MKFSNVQCFYALDQVRDVWDNRRRNARHRNTGTKVSSVRRARCRAGTRGTIANCAGTPAAPSKIAWGGQMPHVPGGICDFGGCLCQSAPGGVSLGAAVLITTGLTCKPLDIAAFRIGVCHEMASVSASAMQVGPLADAQSEAFWKPKRRLSGASVEAAAGVAPNDSATQQKARLRDNMADPEQCSRKALQGFATKPLKLC